MTRCPGCGAEIDAHMTQCWECHETISSAKTEPDDSEFDDDFDDDLDGKDNGLLDFDEDEELDLSPKPQARPHASAGKASLEDAADALLAGGRPDDDVEDDEDLHVPDSAVVAYVAQDEVQAGAISQLLSDCGIRNFATAGGEDEEKSTDESTLKVQVMKEDLAAAQQVIAEFTSEFDDFS